MKKPKKNRVLRLMCIVLLFTLISTCMMTGTLAKYVTVGSGSDTARVAKWGVLVDAATSASGLFSTTYATHDSDYGGALSVISSSTDKVVAPGTNGSITGFSITGTPEVACRITVDVDASSVLTGWTLASGAAYEPIVWTLSNGGTPLSTATNVDFATLLTELGNISVDVAPNTNLASVTGFDYEISWNWPFVGNDANDTYLGDLTAAPTITLAFDITVTQID